MAAGVFNVETARELLHAFRELKSSGLLRPGVIDNLLKGSALFTPNPVHVRNVSGETIPAYACMQVVGTVEVGRRNLLQVDKPADATGDAGAFVFNGPRAIAAGESGATQFAYHDIVRAILDSGTVTAGEHWAPVAGQWYIEQSDGGPFVACGEDDVDTNVLKVAIAAGSGGGSTLEFTISSVTTAGSSSPYNGLKVATCTVEAAPCDQSALIGTTVSVVDHSGCLFNETNEALVGRYGWAHEQITLSLAAGAEEGELTPCHWSALNICCP